MVCPPVPALRDSPGPPALTKKLTAAKTKKASMPDGHIRRRAPLTIRLVKIVAPVDIRLFVAAAYRAQSR
jgi:hypothetical protein